MFTGGDLREHNIVQSTTPTFIPHLQTNGRYHNNQLCSWSVFPSPHAVSMTMLLQLQRETAGWCRAGCCRSSRYRRARCLALFHCSTVWKNANDTETCPRPCRGLQKQRISKIWPLFSSHTFCSVVLVYVEVTATCLRWHWLLCCFGSSLCVSLCIHIDLFTDEKKH